MKCSIHSVVLYAVALLLILTLSG